ncbi:MAG: hypothetical protein M1837_002510 [Sclerophora amabilis]|nr:MAG: hypothetical protein M1837_002510 [Sclerophora amabilis]
MPLMSRFLLQSVFLLLLTLAFGAHTRSRAAAISGQADGAFGIRQADTGRSGLVIDSIKHTTTKLKRAPPPSGRKKKDPPWELFPRTKTNGPTVIQNKASRTDLARQVRDYFLSIHRQQDNGSGVTPSRQVLRASPREDHNDQIDNDQVDLALVYIESTRDQYGSMEYDKFPRTWESRLMGWDGEDMLVYDWFELKIKLGHEGSENRAMEFHVFDDKSNKVVVFRAGYSTFDGGQRLPARQT